MPKTFSIVVLFLALAGAPAAAQSVAVAAARPTLAPGDVVKIQIWQEPDLSGLFRVADDGQITLPLLGPRPVTQLSVEQLRSGLMQDYAYHLKNPSVEVSVLRRLSVLGAVQQPGIYDVEPSARLGDVLALAGGVTTDGNQNDIDIVRDGGLIAEDLALTAVIGDRVRSGDQIMVDEKSWMSRNGGKLLIGIGTTVTALAIREMVFKD